MPDQNGFFSSRVAAESKNGSNPAPTSIGSSTRNGVFGWDIPSATWIEVVFGRCHHYHHFTLARYECDSRV